MTPLLKRSVVSDLLALCGVGLAGYGLWQVYPPAAWIAAGVLLVVVAVAVLRR
jgi:hypothetical protein